ncbi:MAG TPA: exodeoxyribonuclease VII large subunit [Pirellulales bacterium]|nr:exodeoxyribonuclease VII large subunit [Pirellulales bacterium]
MTPADLFGPLFPAAAEPVLTVGQLTAEIKDVLESSFDSVWVSGEISNLSRPQSGHCYLTLKDESAQLRAVLWRTAASRLRFDLDDGLEVICQGHLDLYAPRGSYQLVIEQILPKGMGALELALRKLRQRLAAEGLFAAERKRPLPRFPREIGIVTSPTGAALRDFLEVLRRRWSGVDVLVLPARVQGEGAAAEIAAAIAAANRLARPIDVLVVARGGGSLEDLWAFNEEIVVRAIHGSRIPIVSAVGHEIDVTLADLVADVRALTPSEAAELVVPSREELVAELLRHERRLVASLRARAAEARGKLEVLRSSVVFRRPTARLEELARRLDELGGRAERGVRGQLSRAKSTWETRAAQLESLSPLAILGRGYSLTRKRADGLAIRSAEMLSPGDEIVTRFAQGEVTSRVEGRL